MTSSLGLLVADSGRARRVRTTREVMDGFANAWKRTSPPMKPVAPVRMTFILWVALLLNLRIAAGGDGSELKMKSRK